MRVQIEVSILSQNVDELNVGLELMVGNCVKESSSNSRSGSNAVHQFGKESHL